MEVDRRLELQPKIFNLINSIWGPHQVDLFVSEEILFIDTRSGSRSYDANMIENEFMDQYSLVLVPRILAKIIREKATSTILVPYWKSALWFLLLLDLLIAPPILFLSKDIVVKGQNTQEQLFRNPEWRSRVSGLGTRAS